MRLWYRAAFAIAGLGLFVGLANAESPAADFDPAALTARFKRDLKSALQDGLAAGPGEAISACRLRAPEIAQELSQHGVRVGRSSDRLRNPANASPDWVRPILDRYLNEAEQRAAVSLAIADGRSGYVEPILAEPLCLTCHGQALAPDVAARLGELYPADQATGYEVGDLRGVFWVEFPTPQ